MNILAPVRRDRVLAELPQCLRKEAALHVHKDFHPRVTCACQEHRTGTVGFKISKIIVVGDLSVGKTCLINRQWLADALKENDPSSVLLFLVGSKKDLSTPAQYALMEKDALQVAQEMKAEYWAVSSLTGENVREFFFRVAALTFEANVLAELERSGARRIGDVVRINSDDSNLYLTASKKKPTCCP